MQEKLKYNCIMILGPTAVGKTQLAVRLANLFDAQIISADSRQVYKGLDLGSGKDIADYTIIIEGKTKTIPYHLIDVATLSTEYSVYDYQKDFYKIFTLLKENKIFSIICGGTGMYLDSIVRGYDLVEVPVNQKLRDELKGLSLEELIQILKKEKGDNLHNKTDIEERHRVLRAIEITMFEKSSECEILKAKMPKRPDIRPFIIGTTFPRDIIRHNVRERLNARLKDGMIDEVKGLHESGVSWERLERLGLEYRFVSEFLQGKIKNYDELVKQLSIAIGQFVKRQETWFRGMERKGVKIHWLEHDGSKVDSSPERRLIAAKKILSEHNLNERYNFDL
ncbi:MAG: tRNA (adenosine(37)-N6)-dimethylallyltransferase MiaA [Treponema sp.]|nr:tRNA (adenosine(37)-N6)-dimethylallyltransferase MiaA [Treponema sp.]